MVFSDTTNKNGGIQAIEFYTGLGDAGISGNATLLKVMTGRINSGFDMIMPRLLSYTDKIRWDDLNHTDQPFGTFDIVSGQSDYTIAEDDNSLDILNLTGVKILTSSTATDYTDIERMLIDDPLAKNAMSPNSTETGIPTYFLEKGNTLFLYQQPNYAATSGVKIFFEREQSYFASTDTTKEPGIPKPFHELPFLYAALDWLLVNKPKQTVLITRVENRIKMKEDALDTIISKRNPVQAGIAVTQHDNR